MVAPGKPVWVNRATDVISTVHDSGVTKCELQSDWAADVVIPTECGCWSNAVVATGALLTVKKSGAVAVGDMIDEPT